MDAFGARVASSPAATAVVCGESVLTYEELAAEANRLARELISFGVGPDKLVAIAMPRSTELIVALLAVLEAGGGYLPIDVSYPAVGSQFLFADAAPMCVLSTAADVGSLPTGEIPVVLVDSAQTRARLAATPPSPVTDAERGHVGPDSAAYVIYTSGSTGTPKGVVVSHRNVLTLFANTQPEFGFDETDVWTMFHSYAFDFSVWELWGALLYGGTLVIVDHYTARSPEKFLELLRRERVTVLNQTPTAFYQLAEADRVAHDRRNSSLSLRYVIFGGEALDLGRLAVGTRVTPIPRRRSSTCMASPKPPCTSPISRSIGNSPPRSSASVVGRAIPGLAGRRCSMRGCGRCRRVSWARCMSRARNWHGATSDRRR